ncbi:aspartate aminotransferase family protein [Planomonospora parontospora subsp. parontospora]|uniref:Aspartate aminotransferase family protein n=2 Tax=Planomonospora parontospora TaxID=58119 RepID=A0AA37F3A1_9ACTN|nr:pyridoxal-dependent decarboxylase [Planomonospora parontospora]GGK55625.1 aspartate aminotransferase family protein [Planomonospora parontospora]GII07358.1 aspartate aminotransferase family protein [Planomonospora parontospora subsp. parontospora]
MIWNVEEFTRAAGATVERLAAYVDESQRGLPPVIARRPPGELAERLGLARWIREGGMTPDDHAGFLAAYLEEGTRLHHPASLGHQVAAPDFPAALADLVHGAANNPMAVYEMGAAAATVEHEVVRWMLEKAGYGAAGGGVLTHGGSLANLTALLAARAAVAPDAWTAGVPGDLALLAPASAHYSLTRAAAILGLGERAVVPLETDPLGRIDVARLPEALDRVRRAGRRPMALVASACATGTGLHDDLRGIGEFCAEHGVRFHVDGAHGMSALLSDEHRHRLDGVELADSLIWDAHKMLRTSSLAAAVLTRRGSDLDAAFRQEASYLFYGDLHGDGDSGEPGGRDSGARGIDSIGRTVECSKAELGLKVFLNLAWRGERGLGDYVARQYATARRLWELGRERPGFTFPYEPESNIVCFRYGTGDQLEIRERLMAEGSFHLTSAEIGGVRHLRATVMAPATDDKTLESLLDQVSGCRTQTFGST